MVTVTLERRETGDQGTFGRLYVPGGGTFFTGELPWRDNRTNISCVPTAAWNLEHGFCLPEGFYRVVMRLSPKFGWTYWLRDVPERSVCLIHPANLAGDVTKGFRTHLGGCTALGYALGWMDGQKAVLRSRPAVVAFMNTMERKPFLLRVVDRFHWEAG